MYSETLLAVETSVAPVALIIAFGYLWRLTAPGGLDALAARRAINALVMYAFYPGFAYHVVSHARFSADFYWIPITTWAGVLLAMALAWFAFTRLPWCRGLKRLELGALLLASAFGNLLSMGLSVLLPIYGESAARYPIYGDVLGISLLFWSLGAGVSAAMGSNGAGGFQLGAFLKALARMPPIWGFALGFAVNILQLPNPPLIDRAAEMLGRATVPVMLLTVGLSLSPAALKRRPALLATACVIKLVLLPAIIAAICLPLFGRTEMSTAIVLLAAMPTMMATVLLSERYGLDTELLASVLVATTLLFFLTLPVWLLILL